MNTMTAGKTMIAGLMGAVCLLLAGATAASAEIACNREGECWHVRDRHDYHPEWGVVVHPDEWRWAANEKYRWREHEGRGYWRNGVWVRF
jgi:hypothetical protein